MIAYLKFDKVAHFVQLKAFLYHFINRKLSWNEITVNQEWMVVDVEGWKKKTRSSNDTI